MTRLNYSIFCTDNDLMICTELMITMLFFSTGDDVYVKSDQDKPAIYRIEKLWIDARFVDI